MFYIKAMKTCHEKSLDMIHKIETKLFKSKLRLRQSKITDYLK